MFRPKNHLWCRSNSSNSFAWNAGKFVYHDDPPEACEDDKKTPPQAGEKYLEVKKLKDQIDELMNDIAEKETDLAQKYKDDPKTKKEIEEMLKRQKEDLEKLTKEYTQKKAEITGKNPEEAKEEAKKILDAFFKKIDELSKNPQEIEKFQKYAVENATITDLEGGWEWMGVGRKERHAYMTSMFLKQTEKNPLEFKLADIMNQNDKFRWHVRLGYIFPPEIWKVKVTDEKTGETRIGTRDIRDKIGYYTDKDEYIAIGENVGAFSGTKIEILEVVSKNDPRYREKEEEAWWDREKRDEIIGSTMGDAERGKGSELGPGAIPMDELRKTSRSHLRELEVPETVIAKRVEARNNYQRIEGQLKANGINTDGLESTYTAAALIENGEEMAKNFGYNFEFEKDLRKKMTDSVDALQAREFLEKTFTEMEQKKETQCTKEIPEYNLTMRLSGTKEQPKIEWLEKGKETPIEDLKDYIDKFVIEKTLENKKQQKAPEILKFIKTLQEGGKFEEIKFGKGYKINLTHLPLLQKMMTDKKYREKVLKLMKEKKDVVNPNDFILAALNEGAEEPTNLPADPNRRAQFQYDPTFQMTGAEHVEKPEIAIGDKNGLRHGQKRKSNPIGVIIHDTVSGWDAKKTAGYFEHAEYTPHYAISKDGKIIQIMPDDEIAHHAGGRTAHRGGLGFVNGQTVGIDLVNWNKREGRYDPYTKDQYKALARLTAHLVTKYGMDMTKIMGHRVVDAHCRRDPSDVFNWTWYQKEVQRLIRTNGVVELE